MVSIRSLHSCRALCNNTSTQPPWGDKLSKNEIKQAIEDAASFDERTGVDEVQWKSSAYHRSEQSYYARPPRARNMDPERKVVPEEKNSDDSCNSVFLFPGQGAQFVGMAKNLVTNYSKASELFSSASEILGYDLLKICLEGPMELLSQTRYCQPAVLVTSLAAVEALNERAPDVISSCIATAGFSVGEITALIFSGALSFEDGVHLVGTRAEAMSLASDLAPGGMITIFHGREANLKLACQSATAWVAQNHSIEAPVCQIANYLYEGAKAIGGHIECLKFIEDNKDDFKIRRIKWIPVSGAFHTPLMNPAVEPFREAVAAAQLADPQIPVYSNIGGLVYQDTKSIRRNLPRQIVECVKWEQSIASMFKDYDDLHLPKIFECGPGTSLTAMLPKINGKLAQRTVALGV